MTTITHHREYTARSHRTTTYHIPENQLHWTGRKPDTPTPKPVIRLITPEELPGVPQTKPAKLRVFFPDNLDLQQIFEQGNEDQEELRRYFKSRPSQEEEQARQQAKFYENISESFNTRIAMRVEQNVELPRPQTSYAVRRPSVDSESERREILAEIRRLFEEGQHLQETERERQRAAQAQQYAEEQAGCPCVIL